MPKNKNYGHFEFQVENMTQQDADALWDHILEALEGMGYERSVTGTYKVFPELELLQVHAERMGPHDEGN